MRRDPNLSTLATRLVALSLGVLLPVSLAPSGCGDSTGGPSAGEGPGGNGAHGGDGGTNDDGAARVEDGGKIGDAGGQDGADGGKAGDAAARDGASDGGPGKLVSTHFSAAPRTWRVPAPSEVPESASTQVYGLGDTYFSLFDINGDARPDLVFTSVRQSSGTTTGSTPGAATSPHWNVHLNTGSGFATTAVAWPVRSTTYHPTTSSRDKVYWATLDIDGDGKVDFLETSDPGVGGTPQPWGAVTTTPYWKVYRNTGTGFATTPLTWRVPAPSEVPESSSAQVYSVADQYYSVFDINGDARPDLVFTSELQSNGAVTGSTPGDGTSPHWTVYLNTGAGFATTAVAWPVRSTTYHPTTSSRDKVYWATLDIDGDGKVDFLETSDPGVGGTPQPWGAVTTTPYWKAYLGAP